MPQEPQQSPQADLDLDEDLFNFEDVEGPSSLTDYDLDEIFASFEEAEQQAVEADEPEQSAQPRPEPAAPLPKRAEPAAAAPAAPAAPPSEPTPAITPPEPEEAPSRPEPAAAPQVAETPRAAEPPPRPAPPPRSSADDAVAPRGFGGKGMVWTLVLIGSLNALVALVVVKSMLSMRGELAQVGSEVTDSTRAALDDVRRSVGTLGADALPEVPPNPEEHPTFEAAREEITNGQYKEARQRLYALLAIIDRFDPVTRAEVEARANYLLAEAVHLEAIAALSEARR